MFAACVQSYCDSFGKICGQQEHSAIEDIYATGSILTIGAGCYKQVAQRLVYVEDTFWWFRFGFFYGKFGVE
jgi:hypothetical protein